MPILPARLERSPEGLLYSGSFGDFYHSRDDALGQARTVFLAGNGLPQRWQGRERFTIVETGFGAGLNFLATWAAWREDARRSTRLHFVSCELHPFTARISPSSTPPGPILPRWRPSCARSGRRSRPACTG